MADAALDNTASARPIDSAAGKLFAGAVLAGCAVALLAGDLRQGPRPRLGDDGQVVLHLDAASEGVVHDRRPAAGDLQVLGGMWMFGKLGSRPAPKWVGPAHRISGSLALLFTLPVAYHCLWSLGFNPGDGTGRRLWHSIFGCLFFGAFTTKVLVVRSRRMPGWALPAVGATLFTVLVLIWLTSSLWFFRTSRDRTVRSCGSLPKIVEGLVGRRGRSCSSCCCSPTTRPRRRPSIADAVAAAGGVDGAVIFGQKLRRLPRRRRIGRDRAAPRRPVASSPIFPDPQDQIAVVTHGRGGMPAFGERLSPEEIAAVVDYTRTVLADVHP